jgi:hypothetical protein
MNEIASSLFERLPAVRYVALYLGGKLELSQRPGLTNASASESDKYEELIVNPTLLKLLTQRGEIDCGGLQYVLIRYGHFFEFVQAVPGGHLSVGIEPSADVPSTVDAIRALLP